ncbi:hypothetical protein ACFSUS_00135 [Spirosoma soli]|uniref:Uncharacterized protein n=2 Tax=Spirosoma soli TaxID=1770529 RepID=A0ABW5LWL9_9BACT
MNKGWSCFAITLGLLVGLVACREEPQPIAPPPDPAALIEGVYGGYLTSQSPSDIYIWAFDGIILLKRVAPSEVKLHSLVGFLTPYRIKLYTKGDSIFSEKNELLDLSVKLNKGQPGTLYIIRRNLRSFRPGAIDLNIFSLSVTQRYQPLSLYKSTQPPPAGSIADRSAGFYSGDGSLISNMKETPVGLIALKAVSADTVQILNRYGNFGPYKVGLRQLPGTDQWSGISTDGAINVELTVTADGPQQVLLKPVPKDAPLPVQLIDYKWQRGSGRYGFVSSQ